jgi:hypothetical protein
MAHWKYNDGGRAAAGYKGQANDCVARAIAIFTERPYREIYQELALAEQQVTGIKSARNGISKKAYKKYIEETLGLAWVPTMKIGQGTTTHLKAGELPNHGRLLVSVSKHMVTMIDGVIHDTHDPSRGGTRAVYGYWF